jgi:hypothetical protein
MGDDPPVFASFSSREEGADIGALGDIGALVDIDSSNDDRATM